MFDFFKQKPKLTRAQLQWNKMWALWGEGNVPSPYLELMNYQSEVNNGGHSQYFFNTANNSDLKTEVETLLPILPPVHAENLRRGYDAFAAMEDIADAEIDDRFGKCDDVFYSNEGSINELLEQFAASIAL